MIQDSYWKSAAEFLRNHQANPHQIVAPAEFAQLIEGIVPYEMEGSGNLDKIEWVLVHKGLAEHFRLEWLLELTKNYKPVFANEVFVLFAKTVTYPIFAESIHVRPFLIKLQKLLVSMNKPKSDNYNSNMVKHSIAKLTTLTTPEGHPNINDLWILTKEINILQLNVKNFGYEIARKLQPKFALVDISKEPRAHGIVSKPTTQADIESPWFNYWCAELKAVPIYHRKLWEFAFILQVLFENDLLREGVEGIGFGCGKEPLASLFASKRMRVCVTDLEPEKVAGLGWAETNQHTSFKDDAFYPDIVARWLFDEHVRHQYVDMNNLPEFQKSFDFCWSVCALEHLGSIRKGLDFIERSLSLLRPGGIAVHTTEYNFSSHDKTIDNWPTVLFQKKHFEQLAKELCDKGHHMLNPDFEVGDGILDRFVDVPPYAYGEGWFSLDKWMDPNQSAHLKLSVDGFPCTCFGIIIKKSEPINSK